MPRITATVSDWTTEDDKGKKTTHKGGEVGADFDFGNNLQEMVSKMGETTVFKQALGALTVSAQGWLRSQFKQGKQADIATNAKGWKPGERKQGLSPREKLLQQLQGMSPEERAALLKDATSAKAAAAAPAPAGKGKKA